MDPGRDAVFGRDTTFCSVIGRGVPCLQTGPSLCRKDCSWLLVDSSEEPQEEAADTETGLPIKPGLDSIHVPIGCKGFLKPGSSPINPYILGNLRASGAGILSDGDEEIVAWERNGGTDRTRGFRILKFFVSSPSSPLTSYLAQRFRLQQQPYVSRYSCNPINPLSILFLLTQYIHKTLTLVSNGFVLPHHCGSGYSLNVIAKKITTVERIRPESRPAAVM